MDIGSIGLVGSCARAARLDFLRAVVARIYVVGLHCPISLRPTFLCAKITTPSVEAQGERRMRARIQVANTFYFCFIRKYCKIVTFKKNLYSFLLFASYAAFLRLIKFHTSLFSPHRRRSVLFRWKHRKMPKFLLSHICINTCCYLNVAFILNCISALLIINELVFLSHFASKLSFFDGRPIVPSKFAACISYTPSLVFFRIIQSSLSMLTIF